MNTNRPNAIIQEQEVKPTGSTLIRWAGLSAVAAGLIFAGIQPIHPPDELSSLTTNAWAVITPLKTVMCLLFLLGITGIYIRQVKAIGRLGLVGYLLLSFSWSLQTAFIFAEAFILPLLVTAAPAFVEGFLGIFNGHPTDMNLGALPALYALTGFVGYMLGGLVFGIATCRAGILPRWAAGLLAVASVLTPLASMLPHELQRLAGMPVGLAIAWLGYALWSERRMKVAQHVPDVRSPQLQQSGAK